MYVYYFIQFLINHCNQAYKILCWVMSYATLDCVGTIFLRHF